MNPGNESTIFRIPSWLPGFLRGPRPLAPRAIDRLAVREDLVLWSVRSADMKKSVFLLALPTSILVSGLALAFQPTLSNDDGKAYSYELLCGASSSRSSISG